MVLIALSRKLFTHSLPLIVAEQCYIKLLKDVSVEKVIAENKNIILDEKMLLFHFCLLPRLNFINCMIYPIGCAKINC